MEAAATACARPATAGYTYARREPEKTALYQVMQQHLLTFEQRWTDEASRTLPKFVLDELHGYMACGILGRGFAHLFCDGCGEHHVVAFSCKRFPLAFGQGKLASAITSSLRDLPADLPR